MFEDLMPDPESAPPRPPNPAGPKPEPAETAEDELVSMSDGFDAATESTPDVEGAELADWKDALRDDFEQWLASLDTIPELDEAETEFVETPDLYSFYQQLAAGTAESRKANRRTAEAISQWGDTLVRFESSLTPLRETVNQLIATQPKEGQMSRPNCLVLVELLDRMRRIAKAFQAAPTEKKSWWGGRTDRLWRAAWESQRQGFAILVSHIEELLKKEGVVRLEALGQPFDPTAMTAIATAEDSARPAQTVLEEFAAGYRRHGELLRAAQVKVNVRGGTPKS